MQPIVVTIIDQPTNVTKSLATENSVEFLLFTGDGVRLHKVANGFLVVGYVSLTLLNLYAISAICVSRNTK
jgi:hypothetical protein